MSNLFIALLNMSISASFAAVAVLLMRLLLKKAPKKLVYLLWLPVLIRLVIPFSISSDFSVFNLFVFSTNEKMGTMKYIPYDIGLMQKPKIDLGINNIDTVVNNVLPNRTSEVSVNPMQILLLAVSAVWLSGVVIMFVYSALSYINTFNKLRTATIVQDGAFESDRIDTPFVFGIFKPKIYLPLGIDSQQLPYILEHEKAHIRRRDYIIKPLAYLTLAVHWFNPLMWVCFFLMNKDMEMASDEHVVNSMGEEVRGGYANCLLNYSMTRSGLLGSPLAFGEHNTKSRIKNILSFRKPAMWSMALAIVVIVVITVSFSLNPQKIELKSSGEVKQTAAQQSHFMQGNIDAEDNNNQDIGNFIDNNINIIVSSPLASSNPGDYIRAHQKEYDSILKLGDQALSYLYAKFGTDSAGLKGHIIMLLCKDILGPRNNVTDETLQPEEWYFQFLHKD